MNPYSLKLSTKNNQKVVDFANNSDDFVEVVLTVDDIELREGGKRNTQTKGFCYPPGLSKPLTIMKNGKPLPFKKSRGLVRAYIYPGRGRYKTLDLDIPTFLRRKVAKKVLFKRSSDEPIEVLECRY